MTKVRPRRFSSNPYSITQERKERALKEIKKEQQCEVVVHKSLVPKASVQEAILEALERYDGQKNISYASRQETIKAAHNERLKIF